MSNSKELNVSKQVYDYLVAQNRVYSLIDIVNNLQKEHGKTAIQRALDQLVSEHKIKEKIYGKQKVYYPDQAQFPDASDADIQAVNAEIDTLNHDIASLNSQIKENEARLISLNQSLTTQIAEEELDKLQKEIPNLKDKLAALESNSVCISVEEKEAINTANVKYTKEYQKRKRMAADVLDAILESYPHGKAKLLEEVGIETEDNILKKKLKI